MKYLRYKSEGEEVFKIFSDQLRHSDQADGINEIISAGFIYITGEAFCFGESISLDIKSRPDDADFFNSQIQG